MSINKKLQEAIISNETYYSEASIKVRQFYMGLIQMLQLKEKEQVAFINELKEKMKKEIMFLEQEVKRITSVMIAKLNPVKAAQESDESILSRRNMLEVLAKAGKIINDLTDVFPEDENTKSIINMNMFNDIFEMIKNKLVIVMPGRMESFKK
jgi:hypothetical protein